MSSSNAGRLRDLTIPQLINILKPSCHEVLLNEIQIVLMDREKGAAADLHFEDVAKELEVLKLVEELDKTRKVLEEHVKILSDKDHVILKLNKKIGELKKENMKTQCLLQDYEKKTQHLDAQVRNMKQQIVDLKIEKSILFEDHMELKKKLETYQSENNLMLTVSEPEKDAQEKENDRLAHVETRMFGIEKIFTNYFHANMGVGEKGNCVAGQSSWGNTRAGKINEASPLAASVYHVGNDNRWKKQQSSVIEIDADDTTNYACCCTVQEYMENIFLDSISQQDEPGNSNI